MPDICHNKNQQKKHSHKKPKANKQKHKENPKTSKQTRD